MAVEKRLFITDLADGSSASLQNRPEKGKKKEKQEPLLLFWRTAKTLWN